MAVTTENPDGESRVRRLASWLRDHGPQVLGALVQALQPWAPRVPEQTFSPAGAPPVLAPTGRPVALRPEESATQPDHAEDVLRALGVLLDDPIPERLIPFVVGEPVSFRLATSDVVARAEAFAAFGPLVVEPFRIAVPDALAVASPEAFAIRFPSGSLAGVTAKVVPGGREQCVVEFADPIELIDPTIDEAPVGEQQMTLFAFRRAGPLGDAA